MTFHSFHMFPTWSIMRRLGSMSTLVKRQSMFSCPVPAVFIPVNFARCTYSTSEVIGRINPNFDGDSGAVYRNKPISELQRALRVLTLLSYSPLVKYNEKLNSLGMRVLPSHLYESLMRQTFYGQFVIGRTEEEARPIMERYIKEDGVNSILYYAMEEDHNEDGSSSLQNDELYERNVENFKESIEITSAATDGRGYIAVKPTALASPMLWESMTYLIVKRQIGKKPHTSYHDLADLTQPHADSSMCLKPNESTELNKLLERASRIIEFAIAQGIGVMIDAEQTYFQPAIRRLLGVGMMEKYNQDRAHVIVTYQCYLKNAMAIVKEDLDYSRAKNFKFGGRLVRGAYLDQERNIAKSKGDADPTNETFQATTDMYHNVSDLVLNEITSRGPQNIFVMFGTHNEDTLRYLLKRLKDTNTDLSAVSFGQLYGMCDHITFHLGQNGISVAKSMPFGDMSLVVSYLGRRAIENRGVLDKVIKEKHILKKEIARRQRNVSASTS